MRRRNFFQAAAVAIVRPASVLIRAIPSVRNLTELRAAFDAGRREIRIVETIVLEGTAPLEGGGAVMHAVTQW